MKTSKEYAEILKAVLQMELVTVKEAEQTANTENREIFYEGIARGLEIAIDKIDKAQFLTD